MLQRAKWPQEWPQDDAKIEGASFVRNEEAGPSPRTCSALLLLLKSYSRPVLLSPGDPHMTGFRG